MRSNLSKEQQAIVSQAVSVLDEVAANKGGYLKSSSVAAEYFRIHLAELKREHFAVAYLDSGMRLLGYEIEAIGSIDEVAVCPISITRTALIKGASYVILGHNHPSGNPQPSDLDIELTRDIQAKLRIFNISVCEHVIVGDTTFSMLDGGML